MLSAADIVKPKTFEVDRVGETRDRKEKSKERGAQQKPAGSGKCLARDYGTNGGPGREEQHSDSGKKSEKEKGSEARGGLVDVII